MMKTSIKLKFRPSVKPEKEGTLYYQLIHERRVKHIKTHYKIKSNEWDELSEAIVVPTNDSQRKHQVESVERCIKWDIQRLEKIVEEGQVSLLNPWVFLRSSFSVPFEP